MPIKDPEKRKKWYRENRRRLKLKKLGLSEDGYDLLLQEQHGKCGICGGTEAGTNANGKGQSLFTIDHCHKTGKVRGLLCNGCNLLLGFAKDDIKILNNAISYLGISVVE